MDLADLKETVRESFNRRFWYEPGSYLYDVVDSEEGGDDASLRPNQVLAVSLPRAVLQGWIPMTVVCLDGEHDIATLPSAV